MITVDWAAVLLGFLFGVPLSVLFFAGLAWGMRLALNSARPGVWLLFSALLRIVMLMAAGLWIATVGDNAWPVAGYALAFFLVRLVAVLWAKASGRALQSGRRAKNATHTG